jgi:hypothetical protein
MVDLQNLSPELQAIDREHARGVRMLETLPRLQKIGLFSAIALEVLMGIFLIVVVFGFVVSGSFADIRAAGAFDDNIDASHAIAKGSDAEALSIGTAKVLQGTPTSYDFFAAVKNGNADWYATFTYVFTAGSTTSRTEEGFAMPGESTYLVSLGYPLDARPSSPTITVSDVVWHRVDHHAAPDVPAWLEDHGGFTLTTPTYAPDIDFTQTKIGRTTFTVTNSTPYGYWSPQFTVVLERAGAVVGISKATLLELDAGDVRPVDVRWYGDLPVTATATVLPSINYFDPASYMPPRGTTGTDVRDGGL